MKHCFIILYFLGLLCQSCSEQTEPKEPYDPNNGIRTVYFDDGEKIKQTFTFKDSLRNGVAEQFYLTGELHTRLYYKDDLKEDTATWFYKSGRPYRKTPYFANMKHGVRTGYTEEGNLKFEMPFVYDEPVRGLKEYTKDGKLKKEPRILYKVNTTKVKGGNLTVVKVSIDGKYNKVNFFRGALNSDGAIANPDVQLMTKNNSIELKYMMKGEGFNQPSIDQMISARVYTDNKSCYVIQRRIKP